MLKKNKNTLISTILSILFVIIFSIFNYEEFEKFHQEKLDILEQNKILSEKLDNFSVNEIKEIENLDFYYTPYKELTSKIIAYIENSKTDILLEVYMLTETRIQDALIKAKKNGIDVKVILEKDPYMAYSINDKAFKKLEKAGIDIIWSSKNNYSFNHTKVLIIDNVSIISTGNYSYSTFTKNRDFFIVTKDQGINKKLRTNFQNDYKGTKINIYDENLIFSPDSSRIKFRKLFLSAEENIKMYFQYMKDDDLVDTLINIKKEKDIEISLIIPSTAKDDINIIRLKNAGVNISILPKYKMHAKAILIDETYLFIGSINFSSYSLDRNREVGILIKNSEIINKFLNVFKQDIKNIF